MKEEKDHRWCVEEGPESHWGSGPRWHSSAGGGTGPMLPRVLVSGSQGTEPARQEEAGGPSPGAQPPGHQRPSVCPAPLWRGAGARAGPSSWCNTPLVTVFLVTSAEPVILSCSQNMVGAPVFGQSLFKAYQAYA